MKQKQSNKPVIMVAFGDRSAEAFTPIAFARRLHTIAQSLSVFGQQAKAMVKIATYSGDGPTIRAIQTPGMSRKAIDAVATRHMTRKYTKRKKTGTKRVLSPARRAAIKKAQAARWAGHKKKS